MRPNITVIGVGIVAFVILIALIALVAVVVALCQRKDSQVIQQQSSLQVDPQNQPLQQILQQQIPQQQIPQQQIPQQQVLQQQAAPEACCTKCGAKIPGVAAFCPVCGQPQK